MRMKNFEELSMEELSEVKGGEMREGGRTVGAGQITEIIE
ncbi:ComC/BlpC family leader-containing pheromone/bacteriocin [Labilibaculum manganireducens]|nr:ComC/BlpC family leader-containing pheromone/bacteriocin [Labilibaculum manganireducens]